MMKKRVIAGILAMGMALGLAACGSAGTSNPSGSAASGSAASASSAADETVSGASAAASTSAAAGDMKLVEPGKLHMATNAAFPPYESTTDNGGFEGIDVEIAKAIAKNLGLELVVDDMEFSSVITTVQSGKEDIAMAGLTETEERKQNVDFTDTYASAVQSVIVPEDSDIKSIDDLEGKKIGCQEGTTGYFTASDTPENGGFGEENVTAYADGATAVNAMLQGKVDAVIIDNEPAKAYVAANEGLKLLDTSFAEEEYAIGISKENKGLYDAVNEQIKQLKEDGTIQQIIDKYIKAEG
jgi:ABC-type amino acid transport substrate-binding protein